MIELAKNTMKLLGFDEDAITSLNQDMRTLCGHSDARAAFETCVQAYREDIHSLDREWLDRVADAAQGADVHPYSAHMLLFLCLSDHLRTAYRANGIADTIWQSSMLDLKWKLWECKAVKGRWGTFVPHWFLGFFHMTRFALGRLQFETVNFKTTYEKNEKVLTPSSKVINVHIPRTLTPLDRVSCIEAYRQAVRFFEDQFQDAPMAFVCSSWLLYPPTREILPPTSNLRPFTADFDVILQKEDPEGERPNAWRLFDMDDTGNVDDYPENSSLRRAYKQYLKDGGHMGSGYGVFFASDHKFL